MWRRDNTTYRLKSCRVVQICRATDEIRRSKIRMTSERLTWEWQNLSGLLSDRQVSGCWLSKSRWSMSLLCDRFCSHRNPKTVRRIIQKWSRSSPLTLKTISVGSLLNGTGPSNFLVPTTCSRTMLSFSRVNVRWRISWRCNRSKGFVLGTKTALYFVHFRFPMFRSVEERIHFLFHRLFIPSAIEFWPRQIHIHI